IAGFSLKVSRQLSPGPSSKREPMRDSNLPGAAATLCVACPGLCVFLMTRAESADRIESVNLGSEIQGLTSGAFRCLYHFHPNRSSDVMIKQRTQFATS